MKQKLLLLLAMLLWGFGANVVLADEPTVVVIEDLEGYTGTDPYVFNQADGKVYVRNNVNEYERYGIFETTSTLKVAGGGDTEIEYIEALESSTHPYINTEYIHKANTRIVAEVNLTANSFQSYEAVFGARRNITNNALIFFSRFGGDDAGCYARATQEMRGTTVLPFGEKITIDVKDSTLNVFTEGDEEPYTSIITTNGFDDGTHPLYIFDLNNGGNLDNSRGFFKLYSFQIYEGEELVMDLKPFVSSTGQAGLKDKVSGKKFFSGNAATFAVSPDGEKLIGEAGITVYEGKMFYNTTDSKIYKWTNGEFKSLGGRTLSPIEFTDYKNMGNWLTNESHMGIFFGENGCHEYDEAEDANYFTGYTGTAYYEPLMIQIPTVENEDYNFSFGYIGGAYESWHNTPMHVFVTNKYDLNMNDVGDVVGGDILATYECPFAGTNEELVNVSMDFTAQKDMETLVAQFGDVDDGKYYWFEFYSLQVSKYGYPEAYPVLNPFGPQLALLIPEAEAFDGNTTTALKAALAEAVAEAKAAMTNEDLLVQRAALEKLQQVLAEAKAADITFLQEVITYCQADEVDVTEAQRIIEEGMTAAEVNGAVYDLRAARKIKNLTLVGESFTGSAAEAGEFWLFNVGTGLYLSMGSDWNTHAAVDQTGWPITIEPAEGGYTLHTAWGSFNNSPYVDTPVNTVYTFQMVEGKENVYNILEGERLLGWNPNGHTDGNHFWSSISNTAGADPADPNFQWIFVTREEREAKMESASLENPVDATFYLDNPNLLKLPGLDMWEKWAVGGNGGARVSDNNNSERSSDFAYEFWNTDSLHFGQVVEGLKPGAYLVAVNAFYRDGDGGHQAEIVNSGEARLRLAYLYANGNKTPLVNIAEYTDKVPGVASQPSDAGYIVNWPWEAIEYFQHSLYQNVVMCVVGEDGILDFGIAKDEKANYGDWVVLDNFHLAYLGEAVQMQQDIVVNRYTGMGYGVTEAEVDLEPAKEFLGVSELTTDMLRIVNPDGTQISDYAPFDGWFDANGVATTWGTTTAICVKFFQAIPDGKFEICDMNGADEAGKSYQVSWALTANNLTYFYNITVTFANKPVLDLTFDNLNVLDEQTIAFTSELGKCYEGLKSDVDVDAILAKLGVSTLKDVTVYAVQPDGSLDDNYKLGTTDGWRNAEGAWQSWGSDARFYVKANFELESGQIYEVGGMDGQNTKDAALYTAIYAFVKNETADAVLLKVTLTYGDIVGVQAIAAEKDLQLFDLMGRKVNRAQKGIYIQDGKKVTLK